MSFFRRTEIASVSPEIMHMYCHEPRVTPTARKPARLRHFRVSVPRAKGVTFPFETRSKTVETKAKRKKLLGFACRVCNTEDASMEEFRTGCGRHDLFLSLVSFGAKRSRIQKSASARR